jgi:hypothetical protein
MTATLRAPNGTYQIVRLRRMHGEYACKGRWHIYNRTTDWLALTNTAIGWGRTRRDALACLCRLTGGHVVRPSKKPKLRVV